MINQLSQETNSQFRSSNNEFDGDRVAKIDKYKKKNISKNKQPKETVRASAETGRPVINMQQNPDLNLMDASVDLENVVKSVLHEQTDQKQILDPSAKLLKQNTEKPRFDRNGIRISKTRRTRRTKISVKDIEETREQIRMHLRKDRPHKNVEFSNIIDKLTHCRHEVTFADEVEPSNAKEKSPRFEPQRLKRVHYIESKRKYNELEWYECPELYNEHVGISVGRQIEDLMQ